MIRPRFKFPPLVAALSLQMLAFLVVFLVSHLFSLKLSAVVFASVCGLVAAFLSYFARLAKWWLFIQALFFPAVVVTLTLKINPSFFLIGFFVLLLVFWNTFSTQVPLYLSSEKVWQALEKLMPPANTARHFRFVDIGSGLGGVLIHLAKIRPDGHFSGIESAPLPFLWSWFRIRLGGYRQCQVQWGDLWDCDLSQYDVVFAYLSPVPMARLWQKAKAEMRHGTVFVSSTFAVPGQLPAETISTDDLHHSTLLIWRM